MNKEHKRTWVAKLRSGEYKQGQGALRCADNTYCCLGVLAEACCNVVWSEKANVGGAYQGIFPCTPGGYDGNLPSTVIGLLGLDNNDVATLVSMNDVRRNTFEEIAEFIEESL